MKNNQLINTIELGWRLARRDFAAMYRLSYLGYFWGVAQPLITALIFILLRKADIMKVPDMDLTYSTFVLTGTVFWQLFVDAINAPINQIDINKAALSKVNFNRAALIYSALFNCLINFFLKFIPVIGILFFLPDKFWIGSVLVFFPIISILLFATTIGVYLLPISILFEDVRRIISAALAPLIFLTPVLYPTPTSGLLSIIIKWNPLSPLISSCRELLFGFEGYNSIEETIVITIVTVFLFFPALKIYLNAMPILIERMEN